MNDVCGIAHDFVLRLSSGNSRVRKGLQPWFGIIFFRVSGAATNWTYAGGG
jgi:hypothetical protein